MKKMKQIWLELKGNGLFGKYQSQFLLIFSFGGGATGLKTSPMRLILLKMRGVSDLFFF